MVTEINSSRFLLNGESDEGRGEGRGGGGNGGGGRRGGDDGRRRGDDDGRRRGGDDRDDRTRIDDVVVLLRVPTNQYRKTRHAGNLSFLPTSGGTPTQPAQHFVTGLAIRFTVTDRDAFYRWTGFFDFDNNEYDFSIIANNQFRVKLDGRVIIDDFRTGGSRTVIERITPTAGQHLVTVEWGVSSGVGQITFDVARIAEKTWRSCDDGLTRDGDPPEGWIRTESGCFKPPLSGEDDTPVIDLLEVIDILPGPETKVERAYVLGSGTELSPHRLKFFNRSTNMTINVALGGPKPTKFVTAFQFVGDQGVGGLPSDSFELPTQGERLVDVLFDIRELDLLPEGLMRSDILIAVSAGTITIARDRDDNIDVGEPLPLDEPVVLPPEKPILPPPPPPPTPTWDDCSTGTRITREGFPPENFILRSDGCYISPPPPPPDIELSITFNELDPLFDGSRSIGRVLLRANLSGDDPNTFSYSWNFDVNRQGAGTGNAAIQEPTVGYRLTEIDLRRLEDSLDRKTTRSVEVIARKGTTIVRARITIVLDNPRLVFIRPRDEEIILRDEEITPRDEEITPRFGRRLPTGGGGGGRGDTEVDISPFENIGDDSRFLF